MMQALAGWAFRAMLLMTPQAQTLQQDSVREDAAEQDATGHERLMRAAAQMEPAQLARRLGELIRENSDRPSDDAVTVLIAAGLSEDARLESELRSLAGAYSEKGHGLHTLLALWALWEVAKEKPVEEYLRYARQLEDSRLRARYALRLLAAHPDSISQAQVSRMDDWKAELRSDPWRPATVEAIRKALLTVFRVRRHAQEYGQLNTPEQRFEYLIQTFSLFGDLSPFLLGNGPEEYWARSSLRELSLQNPLVVGRLVRNISLEDFLVYRGLPAKFFPQYKKYLLELLGEEARRAAKDDD